MKIIKRKQYIRIFRILGLYLACLILCGMTPQIQELTRMLTEKTQIIVELRAENTKLKGQIQTLEIEKKEDFFVIETVNVLTKGATASRWANPKHIKYVRSVCKKYEYIIADIKEKEKLACWQFVFAWCLGTGLNPNHHKDDDGNGYWDNGIADLNDVCLNDIQKELPNNLKKADWFNIEKSIAGLYIWIKQRYKKMPWAILNYEQWMFYAKVK